jgi:hypothetical protein
MAVDSSFTFYLRNEWNNDYFCLHDGNKIEATHDTLKIYSFNSDSDKWYHPLPEFDLFHVYLSWNRSSTANGFVWEMITESDKQHKNSVREYTIESMKVSDVINMSSKTGFNIKFTSDSNAGVQNWFKRFVLEYVMLD